MDQCPNCNTKISEVVLAKNSLIQKDRIALVNKYNNSGNEFYCDKCFPLVLGKSYEHLSNLLSEHIENLNNCINKIPMVTVPNPNKWDFEIVEMVTSQSVTGTGIITEIVSSITDALGMQSERTNKKIRTGENLCKLQLRKDAYVMGCNAIIGIDIEYSQVGGDKGMLLVCMTGTAVKVSNTLVFSEEARKGIDKIPTLQMKIKEFKEDIRTINALGIALPDLSNSPKKGYSPI